MIYFAQAEGTDRVKIGFTSGDPAKRVSELQTGCPYKLRLLASVDGSEQDEGNWHKQFAADREQGEWFRMSWQLCLAIARAEAGAVSPVKPLVGCEVLFNADEQRLIALQFPCPACRGTGEFVNESSSGFCGDCNGTRFMSWRQGVEAANDAPFAMVCEKRHHNGKSDVSYPAIFCMVCGQRIAHVKDGNAYWMPNYVGGEQFYASRSHVVFAHKKCNHGVGRMSSWMPLEAFVAYLGRNLGMNIRSALADSGCA